MHALNMYFGGPVFDEAKFDRAIREYDAWMRDRYGVTTSAAAFDLVGSDQLNLVAWILRRYRIVTRYVAIGQTRDLPTAAELDAAPGIFIYNQGHIWVARRGTSPSPPASSWYLLDSLAGGPRAAAIGLRTADTGYMVVVDAYSEWVRNCAAVEAAVAPGSARKRADVDAWVARMNITKRVLGDAEVPLGCAIGILETFATRDAAVRAKYAPIVALIARYNEFIRIFTRGRYNDLRLVRAYVPDLVVSLMALWDRGGKG